MLRQHVCSQNMVVGTTSHAVEIFGAEQQPLSDLQGKHPAKHMGLADLLETEQQAEGKALDKKVGLPTAERRNKISASYD